jgi:hypothetical protein
MATIYGGAGYWRSRPICGGGGGGGSGGGGALAAAAAAAAAQQWRRRRHGGGGYGAVAAAALEGGAAAAAEHDSVVIGLSVGQGLCHLPVAVVSSSSSTVIVVRSPSLSGRPERSTSTPGHAVLWSLSSPSSSSSFAWSSARQLSRLVRHRSSMTSVDVILSQSPAAVNP